MSVFFKLALISTAFFINIFISYSAEAVPTSKNDVLLFISPQRLTIKSDQKSASALVVNKSDKLKRYDLKLIDQEMGEFGITIRKKRSKYSVKRIVRFVPRRFTLKPGERQTIRIMARRSNKLKDGDYHSHLLFRDIPITNKDKKELQKERIDLNPAKLSFEVKMNYGIAIPIIVQVGKIRSDINFGTTELQVTQDPKSGVMSPELRVSFLRSGNAEAEGFLKISYIGDNNKEIQLIHRQSILIYHEADKVTKTFSLSNPPEGVDISRGKIILTLTKKLNGKEIVLTKEVALN